MNLNELAILIKLLRDCGITYYKDKNVELYLANIPVPQKEIPKAPEKQLDIDDLLYYSSGRE
jgi:hypothetical protein